MTGAAGGEQTKTNPATVVSEQPLIPEAYVDIPSQRLYVLSLGLLCQAIKIFDWLHSLVVERSSNLTLKWVFVDTAFCLILKRLRIPRLNYAATAVILQLICLALFDGVLFGTVQVGLTKYSLTSSARDFYSSRRELSTTGRMVNLRDLITGDDHLKGEHTVRMSPISTAKLNPGGQSFCLGPPTDMILIPVLLNNTKPSHIRYSISAPGSERVEYFDLNSKDLRAIEQQRLEASQADRALAQQEQDTEVDWDDDDDESDVNRRSASLHSSFFPDLEKTQSIVHIKVTKPGIVRLDRVLDTATPNMARIFHSEINIVSCPVAEFTNDNVLKKKGILCAGSKENLSVKVSGVPPLSLRWHREINQRREYFDVDRIENSAAADGSSQTITVPIDMPLSIPGSHVYILDTVTDGLGNARSVNTHLKEHSNALTAKNSRSVDVLRRSAISFSQCAPGRPATLLLNSETTLSIVAKDSDIQDGPWDITVKYEPGATAGKEKNLPKPWVKKLTMPVGEKRVSLPVNSPGEYAITGIQGQQCPGDVLSPETCKVVLQPYPSAEINWKRIHECSGDTGVSASLVLHGKPPFQVYYQQKRNNEDFKEMSRIFQGSRGEITLQPESSGNYTYTFTSLSDANYKRTTLKGPTIHQVVHPLAAANFAGSAGGTNRRSVNSCSGNTISVDIDLRGDGPWKLEVQTVGPKGSETHQFMNLKKKRESIEIPIPSVVDEEDGAFQIDLVSIEDTYGCKKELSVPGMSVNVRRVKPTARFYTKDGTRELTVLENEEARLPMRLTGEGPWKVTYQINDTSRTNMVTLRNPNDDLVVRQRGRYRLLEVSDSQCTGELFKGETDYTVFWIPHPVVKLSSNTKVTYEKYNGSFIRAPICEGTRDYVDLDISGRAPFRIGYNVATSNGAGGSVLIDTPIVSSVQNQARIELATSQAGRIYYELKSIADANYPADQPIPLRERLLFEQEVLGRPSAEFKRQARLMHCLRDTFVPKDAYTLDDLIILKGRPPFHLQLSVKNLASSEVHRQTIELWDTQWKIDLPNYVFSSIGPHLVTIESVRDASSCEQAVTDPLKKSIWVDVAESAAIVPFDHREHFCVGDITQFQLEGIPPWTIGYTSSRKQHEQVVKQSPFALVQQYPGEFSITSISHQQQMCKTAVDDIHFQIHALPSAKVAEGREYIEDIHEGSQAQIIFTLAGEPPFTFTYQRSELPSRKGAKPGKVLETHTVSGVMSHEYSIYSALEGTWTVTFIADKFCRYPPSQPETLGDKMKN